MQTDVKKGWVRKSHFCEFNGIQYEYWYDYSNREWHGCDIRYQDYHSVHNRKDGLLTELKLNASKESN